MRIRVMRGRKGDFIGSPFCLIDRGEQAKVREGEEWEVGVVKTIKDKRGRDVEIVKPIKRILQVKGGRVYCGDIEIPAERKVVEILERGRYEWRVRVRYRTGEGEIYAEEDLGVREIAEYGEGEVKSIAEEEIRRREEEKRREEEEERKRREEMKKTWEERVGKRAGEIEKQIEEWREEVEKFDLSPLDQEEEKIREEIKNIKEKIKKLGEGEIAKVKTYIVKEWGRQREKYEVREFEDGKVEILQYEWVESRGCRIDGDHFVGLGREWVDGFCGWKYRGEVCYTKGDCVSVTYEKIVRAEKRREIKRLEEILQKKCEELDKVREENNKRMAYRRFLKYTAESSKPVVEKIEEDMVYLIAYPTPQGFCGELVKAFSDEIEDIDTILYFAEGIEDTAYPNAIGRFLQLKEEYKAIH